MLKSIKVWTISLLQFLILLVTIGSFTATLAKADAFDDCVNKKIQEDEQLQPFTYPSTGTGCKTKATNGVTGERDSCAADVCYDAPPGRTISDDVKVSDSGSNGSVHKYSPPQFSTTTDGRIYKVCVHVEAWSETGRTGGRGWQEVQLVGSTKGFINQDHMREINKVCAQEVYEKH